MLAPIFDLIFIIFNFKVKKLSTLDCQSMIDDDDFNFYFLILPKQNLKSSFLLTKQMNSESKIKFWFKKKKFY